MKKFLTEKGNEILLYESASECPIERYSAFQKQILISSGIGSSVEQLSERFNNMSSLLSLNKKEELANEISNGLLCCASVLNGINYEGLAFCCRVKSIDGVLCDDISESGLERTYLILLSTGVSQGLIEIENGLFKKKF